MDVKQFYLDELEIGQSASMTTSVTAEMVETFARISGDINPVHLDEDYAATTMFKGRIAHGALTASFVSAVIGTQLPGKGTIYVSQSNKFLAPVMLGDEVVTTATVKEIILEKKRLIMETQCKVGDTVVLEGESILFVKPKPTE